MKRLTLTAVTDPVKWVSIIHALKVIRGLDYRLPRKPRTARRLDASIAAPYYQLSMSPVDQSLFSFRIVRSRES